MTGQPHPTPTTVRRHACGWSWTPFALGLASSCNTSVALTFLRARAAGGQVPPLAARVAAEQIQGATR